jgi:hypothetical protein
MIPKIISPHSYDFERAQVSILPFHSRGLDDHHFKKVARESGGLLFEKELREMKPIPGHTVIHVIAVGDEEAYGENRNYDGFAEEDNKKCHSRFKTHGHVFKDHVNDDPEGKTGDVVATGHNDVMKRIELLAALDNSKNEDEVEELENGGDIPVSMGTLQEHDVCSACGHKAPTSDDHCFHIKNLLGEVLKDGTKVYMKNPNPWYMDLSTVWKPADRIGYTLRKVALEGVGVPGYKAAERVGMKKLASEKRAMMRRLAMIEKRLDGMAQLPSTAPEDLDPYARKALKTAVAAHGVDHVLDTLHGRGYVLSLTDFADVVLDRPGLAKHASAAAAQLQGGFTGLLRGGIELSSLDGKATTTPFELDVDLDTQLRKTGSVRGDEATRRTIRNTIAGPVMSKLASVPHHLPDPTAERGLAELYLHYKVAFANHARNRADETALQALCLSNVLPG